MKKMEKIAVIIRTITAALEQFRRELEMQVGQPVVFRNTEAFEIEEEGGDYFYPSVFITLFDKGDQKISGNWMADEGWENTVSSRIQKIMKGCDLNILHYLCGKETRIKDIRYVNIAQREFISHDSYTICKEKGWKVELFKRVATPYEKSFIYSRKEKEVE